MDVKTYVDGLMKSPERRVAYRLGLCSSGRRRRMMEPVAESDPGQPPEVIMEFALIPPGRVPPEGKILIKLHQVASMKNPRPKRVHFTAARLGGSSWSVCLEEGPETLCCARHIVLTMISAFFAVKLVGCASFGK